MQVLLGQQLDSGAAGPEAVASLVTRLEDLSTDEPAAESEHCLYLLPFHCLL